MDRIYIPPDKNNNDAFRIVNSKGSLYIEINKAIIAHIKQPAVIKTKLNFIDCILFHSILLMY